MIPGPAFTFAFIVATLLGAGFHLIVGGDARRLTLFLLSGWFGFALGQIVGNSMAIQLWVIGELRMLPAIAGAMMALLLANLFTNDRTRRRSPR